MIATDRARLYQHINTLDDEDRLILILAYAEQLSTAEIAVVVDAPEAHVLDSLRATRRVARNILHARVLN